MLQMLSLSGKNTEPPHTAVWSTLDFVAAPASQAYVERFFFVFLIAHSRAPQKNV